MRAIIIISSFLLVIDDCESLSNSKKPLLRRIQSAIIPFTVPWYSDGVQFSCTSCGKCCQVDGDVWLAPEEVQNIMQHLGYDGTDPSSSQDFRKRFVRAEVAPPDGNPSQSWLCLKRENGCVFLDPIGKCSIYDVRPVQCETYPFWPSLIESREDWETESVIPDHLALKQGTNERYWSTELGGCEGIVIGGTDDNNKQVEGHEIPTIERREINLKMRAAKKHWNRFPIEEIKESTWYF